MINQTVLNYRITEKIGEGGMGTVYLAVHDKLGRKAAIKVLNPVYSANPEIRDRFVNEALTLSKLNHTNIVTLFDFTEIGNELLLIMEYVDGRPLDTIISADRNFLSGNEPVEIFKQILQGFDYAHTKNVVHRDVKPSNIIVNHEGIPKILDFGIAKIIEGNLHLTKTGTRMGSPMYMSPEQVLGSEVDMRSDIYSLGITFFEMLTGYIPYGNAASEYEIQHNIVNTPLPSVRAINPAIDESFDLIIQKATQKNPDLRFQNCKEFISAFGSDIQQIDANKTQYSAPAFQPLSQQNQQQPQYSSSQQKKNNMMYYIGGGVILIIALLFFLFVMKDSDNTNQVVTKAPDSSSVKNNKLKPDDEKIDLNKLEFNKTDIMTEREVKDFINEWCSDQTNHRIDSYINKYNTSFSGIKRTKSGREYYYNYSQWVSDRRSMYAKATNLSITAENIKISNASQNYAEVSFKQYYISNNYSDEGIKKMKLERNTAGTITIVFEELIYSTSVY